MAKDDYQVIVYQILSYLYNCLKKGIDIEPDYLIANGNCLILIVIIGDLLYIISTKTD